MARAFSIGALLLAVMLAGCRAPSSVEDLDAPIFGRRHETTFVVSSDRTVNVHELAHFAKVIRFYKDLTPNEVAAIRARLQREVDDLISLELNGMRPQLEQQKSRLKVEHKKQLDAARSDRVKTAKLVVDQAAELQRLEQEAKRLARERVLARLGNELALPLRTNDNRSAVAFGKLEGEQFQVTSKAYEIDVAASKLNQGAKITTLDGSKATLIGKPQVPVGASQ